MDFEKALWGGWIPNGRQYPNVVKESEYLRCEFIKRFGLGTAFFPKVRESEGFAGVLTVIVGQLYESALGKFADQFDVFG